MGESDGGWGWSGKVMGVGMEGESDGGWGWRGE